MRNFTLAGISTTIALTAASGSGIMIPFANVWAAEQQTTFSETKGGKYEIHPSLR